MRVRQNEGLNQWQKNHFRLMKMVEYQESVVQGALERLLTRIGIEYSRKEYVPTNDEILDKLMSIDPEVQKLVLLNGKAAAMEMFVKQNYDLKGRYRNIFQGGRVPRNMTLKVINDYLDEVQAPSMEPLALEAYTSQMRTGLAEVTQRHIAKSVAQMTAWNWSRGRGIEELTRRFQEEQKKEQIDMSKVLPNAETVVRTESMKILNAEAWRSATEVGSYADGLLWGFSYHAVGDSRTRQTHLAQHGVCAPVDDPFWNEWTPPNGYNCRCWLISEWEEPSSYKQPRRDLHPDPGFAFNPTNNVAGRVPQQKKPEVNIQPQESVGKPDELGKDDATFEKNFEKKRKNIQKTVTTLEKKRYNKGASSKLLEFCPPRPEEPLIPEVQNGTIIPTPDGKFYAVHGPMVKTTRTTEEAAKAIRDAGGKETSIRPPVKGITNRDFGPNIEIKEVAHKIFEVWKDGTRIGGFDTITGKYRVNGIKSFKTETQAVNYLVNEQKIDSNEKEQQRVSEEQKRILLRDAERIGAKLIEGEHSIQQDLMATNPLYGTEGKKYTDNCQRCVIAYELRRRGLDVSAKPCAVDENGNSLDEDIMFIEEENSFGNVFKNPRWISCGGKTIKGTKKKITDKMALWGDGARAIVSIDWYDGSGGHAFIAEQHNGITHFVDPQKCKFDVEYYFNLCVFETLQLLRIDNRRINNISIATSCCNTGNNDSNT